MYTPLPAHKYEAKAYDLHGLHGMSDQTMVLHVKLYEGYVAETNRLTSRIRDILVDGKVDQDEAPAYSEFKRRLGFEYNGMVLHENYFDSLTSGGSKEPTSNSAFRHAAEESFGTYEAWKVDFMSVGKIRGVGWAICYLNPYTGKLSNHWITLHEVGHVAGFIPVLVVDVWEHAFILDYLPAERDDYIDAFFENVNWSEVEHRLTRSVAPTSTPPWV
ncbi:MAG: Fe-Mn family superoxide dismutase [Nitrospira sp.]|nr:hypothetical protein [Nitrospira sp.]